jgi:hypothetical protein
MLDRAITPYLAILGTIIGLPLLGAGIHVCWQSSVVSSEPEEMSLQVLIARGPSGNPHVRITQFRADAHYVVQLRQRTSRGLGQGPEVAEVAFIPIMPILPDTDRVQNADPTATSRLHAVIRCLPKKGALSVDNWENKSVLHGTVSSDATLPLDSQKLLAKHYPKTEFSRVLIIDEGHTPVAPASVGYVLLIVGGGMFLLSITICVLRFRRNASAPRPAG